ncbi:uncharacterized protein [Lolium perenne]|uniref:uncharacterized protein n=1 Tax=Lolium perenne TaxID=4522 RepID=UPI0021F63FEF|nr:uncharacterized protein LOC127305402 [Lolium perenne]
MGDQSSNQQGQILQRLRNIFAQDPKGKGEMITPHPNRNEMQSNPDGGFHGGVGTQYTLPVIAHQPYEQPTTKKDTDMQNFQSKADKGIPNHYQQIIGEKSLYTYSHQGPPLIGNVTGVVQDYPAAVNGVIAGDISINPVSERHSAKEMTEKTQQQPNKDITQLEMSAKSASSKRSAPSTEIIGQPSAKKSSISQNMNVPFETENAARPTLMQCTMRAISPYNPSPSLTQNAQLMDGTLKQQHDAEPSILGTAPPLAGLPRPVFPNVFINNEVAGRKKLSRWDMKTQGTTHFTPGSATWKRHVNAGRGKSVPTRINTMPPPSPCRSDATSAIGYSYEHEPWPLHTPAASLSQETQDSRRGAFSPPQMTREFYVAPTALIGQSSGNMQEEANQGSERKEQDVDKNGNNNTEAAAPAFKAPRAP